MATLEYKTTIIRKVLSEVNLDINDSNVHKYADYTGFVKPRLNAIYDIISKIAPTPFVVNNNYVGKSIANRNKGYDKIKYYDISNILISLIKDATGTQLKTLFYIINNLEWNSNIVYLSYEEVNKEIPMSLRFYTDSIANLRRYNLIASVDIDNNTYVINHNAMFFGNFNQFIETYNKLYDGKYAPVNKYNKINLRNTTLDDFVDNIDEYFRNNIYDNILTKEEINRAAATNQNKVR